MKLPLEWDIPLAIAILTCGLLCMSVVSLVISCNDRDQDIEIAVIQTVQARQDAIRTLTPK